jgi:hypothetical protein
MQSAGDKALWAQLLNAGPCQSQPPANIPIRLCQAPTAYAVPPGTGSTSLQPRHMIRPRQSRSHAIRSDRCLPLRNSPRCQCSHRSCALKTTARATAILPVANCGYSRHQEARPHHSRPLPAAQLFTHTSPHKGKQAGRPAAAQQRVLQQQHCTLKALHLSQPHVSTCPAAATHPLPLRYSLRP